MPDRPHFPLFNDQADVFKEGGAAAISDPLLSHHEVEQLIWRELQSLSHLHFSTLTVRRVPAGVCLQGVVEADDADACVDIDCLVKRIANVEAVVNLLLVRESSCPTRFPR